MQLFFTKNIKGNIATFETEEARHIQVLRKNVGDVLQFVDGEGGMYKGEIIELHKKQCLLSILEHIHLYNERKVKLHIGIAPTKNIARLEWFLEKATEIGIEEITPILCDRSERKRIRTDRLEKITMSAMKQSLKAFLPKLNELTNYQDFIKKRNDDIKYIAYCNDNALSHLKKEYSGAKNVTILIGPEGDFSPKEVKLALENSFQGISLGTSRLRTETAGIAACHIISLAIDG
ncbi:MAG: 16S rRNA (uracil(1498)-N(3))-methyltransferase [Saprospiraceae bacterium]|nr:16S rRNA (uracil(1498)-N(3))-methyltransferase [Saprospiraceae bacterium]